MQSSQSVGGVCVPPWLLLTSGSSSYFHCCGCRQKEAEETVSGQLLHYGPILRRTQLRQRTISHTSVYTIHNLNIHSVTKDLFNLPTDALWLRSAPVGLRCVDTSSHLVAADLEARVAVEVCLTSGMDVCHRHPATHGGQGKRARQQKGCWCEQNRATIRLTQSWGSPPEKKGSVQPDHTFLVRLTRPSPLASPSWSWDCQRSWLSFSLSLIPTTFLCCFLRSF